MTTSVPEERLPVRRKPKFRDRHLARSPVQDDVTPPPAAASPEAPAVESTPAPAAVPRPRAARPILTVAGAIFGAIIILAFMLRVWDVGSRAMHLDESTVAWYAWQLLTGNGYAYDPVYHGPFQHEMLALIFLIFQPSETSARMLAVVLGTGLVALPWFIRDYLGRVGALFAAFLLAISPSFVYFARFERDDTYMEFFTFLLVVFALRYARDRRPWQLYGAAVAFALAFATKESIYIVVFIFGTYLLLLGIGSRAQYRFERWYRQYAPGGVLAPWVLIGFGLALAVAFAVTVTRNAYPPVPIVAALLMVAFVLAYGGTYGGLREGPVAVLRSTPRSVWINSVTIAVAIAVLMYSTFGTNLNGLWDHAHPFFNTNHACQYPLALHLDACRRDMIGGLFYWLSQHKVARGGQPWFYYTLIFGLYEQIALLFGAFGLVRTLLRPTSGFRVFVVYWTVLAYGIYSWAGEKFPWLGIHPLLPLTLLAAIGIADLFTLRTSFPAAVRYAGAVVLALLIVAAIHNTYEVNYVNGANPVEMMVYVQSAPNTVADAHYIERLSNQATNGATLPVTIDSTDAWPFAWYLRSMPNAAYPAGAQAVKTPFVNNPVLIIDQGDAANVPPSVTRQYSSTLHRLNWWFPEDYKAWSWHDLWSLATRAASWSSIWQWETSRHPFGPRDGTWYYLYVKKGYFSPY